MTAIAVVTLLLWLAAVIYQDISARRISNYLSLGGVFVAVVVIVLTRETVTQQPYMSALMGFLVALLLTLPGYGFKLLGGGDVKLLCAIGLLCGFNMMISSFVIASLSVVAIYALGRRALMFNKYIPVQIKPKERFIPFGAALAGALMLVIAFDVLHINLGVGI